jgi:hypothetical protein
MTFAQHIEIAAQSAHNAASPDMASLAEVCDAIQPIITKLQQMPRTQAIAYIRESYSHIGHQALAMQMFKIQSI